MIYSIQKTIPYGGQIIMKKEYQCLACNHTEMWSKKDTLDGDYPEFTACEYCEDMFCSVCWDEHIHYWDEHIHPDLIVGDSLKLT